VTDRQATSCVLIGLNESIERKKYKPLLNGSKEQFLFWFSRYGGEGGYDKEN